MTLTPSLLRCCPHGARSLTSNRLTGVAPSYLCDAPPSTCDLVDSSSDSNQYWCTSICNSYDDEVANDGPCGLTTSNCVTLTTLEYTLTDTYGSCYDPTGASCTCTGSMSAYADDGSITGTIPSALSACTGLVGALCVASQVPAQSL